MITRINEFKSLVKHILCDGKCKINSNTCNSNQKWNNGKCQDGCKKYSRCRKEQIWNPSTWIFDYSKYLKKYC